MVDTSQLTDLISALRAETEADSISPERVGYVLQRLADTVKEQGISLINGIKGWKSISSINELPGSPNTDERGKGYLLGTVLYVYVGTGGDTLDGKYQSADLKGGKGDKGDSGVHLGDVQIADDLATDDATKVLSAKQGKVLKEMMDNIEIPVVNDLTTGGEDSALSAEMGKVLNENLSTIKGSSKITYTHESENFWTRGKYWKGNGLGLAATLANDTGHSYSKAVAVRKGDIISYSGGGYGWVIVKCNEELANATCLVASPSTYGTATAELTVTEDGFVSFGYYSPTAAPKTCNIVITKNVDKIADLEDEVSQHAEGIATLNAAVENIEAQLTEDLFPKQRMSPLFWNRVDTYDSDSQRKASRNNLMTDWIEIPDGAKSVNISVESGDGTPLTDLWPQIYFADENFASTSTNTNIAFGTDRNIPTGSKYYRLRFGYSTANPYYRALLPSYMQKKFILFAPMTHEQYDKKFMLSYEDGRQQLHTYDWDDLKLTTACMAGYGAVGRKDFQLAIITDSHGDALYADNFFRSANDHLTIDAIVHCGDWQPSTYNQPASRKQFIELFSKSTKPVYVAIGNHDHGYNYVSMSASQKMLYNDIVVPMIENGWLADGEYTEDKCYYYHDFVDEKVRLIVVNDFDNDDLAENEYWEPVTYDPDAPAFQYNHIYTYSASTPTIVNCGEYNEHSFKLKKSVTTEGSGDPYMRRSTIPCMAVDWQSRIFSAEQAQWLADTLLSTPANFKVVIASHMPFSLNVTLQNKKFCQYSIPHPEISYWYAEHIATDFLAAVVDAFQRGVAFSHKVVMQGLASYLNTQTSGGLSYAYEVTANFANKNSGATFMCFIGGHCHPDLIWKHNAYTQWGIYAMATKGNNGSQYDILDLGYPDHPNCNHWTAIALGQNNTPADRRIGLARVGKDLTKDLTRRDVEFIDTSE